MKKIESKKAFVIGMLSLALVSSGIGAAVLSSKKAKEEAKIRAEEERKKMTIIANLQSQNRELSQTVSEYDARRDFYASKVESNARQNPDCDDMDKLYLLSDKMDSVVASKYNEFESKFIAKCKKAVKGFENRNGQYHINGDGGGDYIMPQTLEDWMAIVFENADRIPNFDALNREYQRIVDLEGLIWDYEEFLGGVFSIYVDNKVQRKHYKDYIDIIKDEETVDLGGGYSLDGTTYHFVDDDVYEYNDKDNIEQNKIIDELLQKYLYPFIVYGENGMKVMDDPLFNQIRQLALRIQRHNSLEAGKISYEQAIAEINKQIKGNQANIGVLQQNVRK